MDRISLSGITWGHSRGVTPLLATAQRFSELNPGIEINWNKRTLQEFAHMPVEKLAGKYDLLIIDHPWVGCAAMTKCVLPLDQYLPEEFLIDQLKNSVGQSHQSYFYGGHQWALAIDAATPTASYRADLFEQSEVSIPSTWDQLLEFAKSGKVLVAGIPVDTLMAFYMFCIANGSEPFLSNTEVVSREVGLEALEAMRKLWSLCDRRIFKSNPIAVAEFMTTTDDFWYCPFAYGYSNYSRRGFAKHLLQYTDLVSFENKGRFQSTLGGTGIAIATSCRHLDVALQFIQWITSGECQATLYLQNGGQPGHLAAWIDPFANRLCNGFFSNTIAAMNRSYVRPRYNGYLHFQDQAGEPVYQYLLYGGDPKEVLVKMNSMYHDSIQYSHE